jgi:hypothetical protein
VNGLLEVLATALTKSADNLDASVAPNLIGLSQLVTETCLAGPNDPAYHPDLFPLAAALVHCFDSDVFEVDMTVVLAIADHTVVGFLPNASLVRILTERFRVVVSLIAESLQIANYKTLAAPLTRTDQSDDVLFFVALWAALLDQIVKRPLATRALATKFRSLLELSEKPGCQQAAAQLLFRFVSANARDRQQLALESKDVVDAAITPVRQRRPSRRARTQPAKSLRVGTRRADVEVLQKKKRWVPMKLIMLEEVRLLSWSAYDNVTQGGAVLEFSDVSHIAVTDAGKKEADKESVVKIMSKKGEFCIAFRTYQEAGEWAVMIKQMCGVSGS